MEEELKSRTRLRGKATRLSNDLREYRKSDKLDQDDLAYKIHLLSQVRTELREVQVTLDKAGQHSDTNHDDVMSEEIFKASRLLGRLESSSASANADRSYDDQQLDLKSSLVVKLPTFDGDVLKWGEFWELFKVSIHSNPRYAAVQKFVLLKSHLGNIPKQTIEGIPVSEEGYVTAVDVLTRRFSRDDIKREMLMKQLLDLPGVSKPDDIKSLYCFVDQLTARVRALETLGVTADSFSSILLPVLRDKLPEAWRLEWARAHPSETADFKTFLDFLQKEVVIREQSAAGPVRTAPAESHRPPPGLATVSGLAASRQPGRALAMDRLSRAAAGGKSDWQ